MPNAQAWPGSAAGQGRRVAKPGRPGFAWRAALQGWGQRISFCAATLLAPAAAAATTLDVDVPRRYAGVSLTSIGRAIADAKTHFQTRPDDTIILRLPAGVFPLSPRDESFVSIDVSGVRPGPAGRLILQGAGSERTTLVFDTHRDEIVGRDAAHVAFIGLHFTTGFMTVTQGHVEEVSPGSAVLRIEDGFPSPADLFEPEGRAGRYLRRCTDDAMAPQIVQEDNGQIPWSQADDLGGGRWRFAIRTRGGTLHAGDLVAVKSKHADGNAYKFIGSDDVTFDDVLWTRSTRGVFRGTNGVKILNSAIRRDGPVDGHVPCLASAGGGPQIGQPRDPPTTGDVVENFSASGTGDDALAFFNASGRVSHVRISDAFARGILLFNSPGMTLDRIEVLRAPVLRQ